MSLLLKRGSYIGHMNKFNVPPIIDIPVCMLSNYFDDCLKMTKNQTNKYIIEFDYRCLMPHDIFTEQDTIYQAIRETEIFLYIARNKSLKHLLKHPLLSFLYLKWLKIRHVLYANFVFYGIFYFLLNAYILSMIYKSSPSENGDVNNQWQLRYGFGRYSPNPLLSREFSADLRYRVMVALHFSGDSPMRLLSLSLRNGLGELAAGCINNVDPHFVVWRGIRDWRRDNHIICLGTNNSD